MNTKTLLSVALLLVLGACGDDDATSTTASTVAASTTTLALTTTTSETTTSTTAVEATTTTDAGTTTTVATTGRFLTTAEDELGEILVDQDGYTLYLFLPDNQSAPTCTGTCALTWPPFDDDGEIGAGAGIDPELLGSVARADGTIQVTYNGWPLYYYLPDVAPGDTRGQGIGGDWWVVDPEGEPVMD